MQSTLAIRVLALFAVVGVGALLIPVDLQVADSQTVYPSTWGRLPLNVKVKGAQ